jgi:hypothetical protein
MVTAGHGHQHRDPVILPNGRQVVCCTHPADGYRDEDWPDFGLYFDPIWQPPWPHQHLDWPDFGLPADSVRFSDALADVLARIDKGQVVEVGCIGGHGRTGTALGCLAVLAGSVEDPVEWVRRVYCPAAVETGEQADLVRRFANDRG